MKGTHRHIFPFTSHTVVAQSNLGITSRWRVLQQTVRPAIHTAEGSAAGQRAGATRGKAFEQNSKERKLSDGAAASDLSHQLTSPEAP